MNGFGKGECLRVKSGFSDAVASRLETRRVAAMRGATIEFSKSEGLAYDPAGNRLFMSIAQIKGAMTNESASADGENDWRPAPASGSNAEHVRLNENVCGAVYALDVRKDEGRNRQGLKLLDEIHGLCRNNLLPPPDGNFSPSRIH